MPFRRLLSALTLFLFCLTVCTEARAQADERERAATEIKSLREQLKQREQTLLSVPAEDRERYAEFLAHPETGLVRLLPREKWDNVLATSGGGSYYSFHALTHEYGDTSDIELEREKLNVGFHGADFGFIHEAGDVPLEELTLEHPSVAFLASYVPPATRAEVDKFRVTYASAGLSSGEYVYRHSVPARAGRTYVLRSVSYGDADTLVAFRVLRKDSDGSYVLLWKTLKKFPKPSLERTVAAAAGQ
jgi:hypothetical protein